jgi:hypothetical protein
MDRAMSDEETAKKVAQERALLDLQDIAALRTSEPFNRYWRRRIKAKGDALMASFRNDPVTKVSHEQREILRQKLLFIEELEKMMSEDEASAQTTLSAYR